MAQVFRLYNIQGNNNIVDWQNSIVYGSKANEEIKDPDGAKASKVITSIPSPFARIDLVKTAFKEVVANGNLDGDTIYHKMVSDTLDVAEIFFNSEKLKDKIEILVWDRAQDLDMNSVFGKTLERYLQSDATGSDPYNFKKIQRFYLLNYIGPDKPQQLNIIGATSPATLFFSSANDLDYVSRNISFGQDRPFDKIYQSLYNRDWEFVKYLYAFRAAYPEFHKDFPEFNEYLGGVNTNSRNNCYAKFTNEQKREIDALNSNSISIYEAIAVGEKGQNTLDVLGRPFHKKPVITDFNSGFEIDSSFAEGKRPLVLPVEAGNTYSNLRYTQDKWANTYKAPYYDNKPWESRILPIVGDEYPYLTISDFLSDTIVRMPYKLNDEKFFDGNYQGAEDSYLLPLTNLFFRFFTVEDLMTKLTKDGKKMLELKGEPGKVKVFLRIPIKNGYVEYTRTYFEGQPTNIEHNDGALVDKKVGLGILPLIQFPENVKKHYRLALFDKGRNDVRLTCYKGNKSIIEKAHIVREPKDIDMNECSKEAYVLNENFDRINVKVGDTEGFIIPKFKQANGNRIYTFAIDFGTTNSHIEYGFSTSQGTDATVVNSFDIPASERQLHRLHSYYSDPDIRMAFEHNFIPDTVADSDDYAFPMRTVFSEWNQNDRNQAIYALANGNIPFLYEKNTIPYYNEVRTELKWRGEQEYSLILKFAV
ncbi:MAG: hypothetical protein LBN27_13460 [Prevotellaceae bacterium]|jgi:hypothetical protein|nr:hypothetical protein [Prevotellaceae bacterium]